MIFDDFHELYQGAVHNRYKWLRVITNCKGRKKCVKFNVVDDGKFITCTNDVPTLTLC